MAALGLPVPPAFIVPIAICADVAVEVIIFRSSNRNKRRGIHNLQIFGRHVRRLNERIIYA